MTPCRKLLLTLALLPVTAMPSNAQSQDYAPPQQGDAPRSLRPPQPGDAYNPPGGNYPQGGNYPEGGSYPQGGNYPRSGSDNPGYGQPYSAPPPVNANAAPQDSGPPPGATWGPPPPNGAYSTSEIVDAGRSFFGGASEGLASVVEYSFQRNGHPNGYILGEEAGGAIVAGLRYGEGTLYTKGYPPQKVFWQGPSLGYDFGANGAKSFTLVYNLQYPVADLRALCGNRRLRLPRRRGRNNLPATRRCHSRAHSRRVRVAFGSQCRLSQVYTLANLEPFLGPATRSVERTLVRQVGEAVPDAFGRRLT